MAKHNNKNILNTNNEILGAKVGEQISDQIFDVVSPVIVIDEGITHATSTSGTGTGSSTLFTASTTKATYLRTACVSAGYVTNAANSSAYIAARPFGKGAHVSIVDLRFPVLTGALHGAVSLTLPGRGLRLEPGQAVTLNMGAATNASAEVTYTEVEVG